MIKVGLIQKKIWSVPRRRVSTIDLRKTKSDIFSLALSVLFFLIALHSFFIGCGLILHSSEVLIQLGFCPAEDTFFPFQGGVFHILLSLIYLAVVFRLEGYWSYIYLGIYFKSMAFLFLTSYYFLVNKTFIVLLSGIVDGIIAVIIIGTTYCYRKHVKGSYSDINKE